MTAPVMEGDLLTVPQAQKLLPVSRSAIYALIKAGRIPHYRISAAGSRRGRILIDRRDLEAFVAKARQTATRAPVRVDVDAIRDRVRRRHG
ncbi:MAG: helix-turn-helix domain-containing protein [Planctomycetota bacterium]|jgi:excisionase family DNA binding protein